ncbi:M60 family metallopeptidase [Capnocytophaga sp.]|uniref:M60 family metallopeptidase n=1 Tax=Capnocytophaga sp. TaxID=44737 RepID=UPI0026DAAD37|nr:M60 family metallopeptidase [Capnocytophaga sp.]MDO5105662.1 M60 family metallopeptidase [Capnocytophaga sp.]
MKKKQLLKMIMFFVVVVFTAINCKKEVQEEPFLRVENVNFGKEATSRKVIVETNVQNWTVTAPTEMWLEVKKEGNGIKVSVSENKDLTRSAKFVVQGGGLSKEVKVTQIGAAPDIAIDKDNFKVEKIANDITIIITANVSYEITLPDWITKKGEEVSGHTTKYIFSIAKNESDKDRNGKIELLSKGVNPVISKTIQIVQKGQYTNDNVSAIEGDIKLKIASGSASSSHQGEDIEKSFDGDMSTIYHSHWTNTGTNYFPITLEYVLENAQNVDYMMYYPRTEGSNGHFKEVEIHVKTEGSADYTKIKDFDFRGNGKVTRVTFNPISNAKSFKLVIKSGIGHQEPGFAAAAEIEFYRKNTENFDPSAIFTDITCSELKAGITDGQIQNISNPFYKDIAQYMKLGQYPSEFRIQEYRAWPNPDEYRDRYRMQYSYSNLDNPTGMSAIEGEDLVVFVGPTQGRQIQIKIQNLNKPGGDGFNEASYHPLYEGVNKFKAGKSGLIYLQYQTTDYQNAPKIKVHFATGKVNGYFDKTKHNAADWNRLINAATNTYFDVIGEKAHLCFPVESYKTHTGSRGKDLIDQFDKLLGQTHKFMGLTKERNKELPNRSYFQVMYTSFMYCTAYRTSYNVGTMETLCNPDKMGAATDKTQTSIWGPAHEIGHAHQVKPTFMWIGMTECTVNMNSMNIQTAWEIPTRLETESMQGEGGYNNRYEKAYNIGIVPKKAFGDIGDVFCNLVPFWQLNLYFSKAKNDPEFSVKLYDKVREVPVQNPINDGKCQVDFTKIISELTGTDLTSFFEKWGFYVPINKQIHDYDRRNLIVTDAYAGQIKNEITALKLLEITDKIEYICDSNWTYFRDQSPVVKGNATKNGSRVTTTGYQNVVAYEVYEGNELIYVSNKNSFDIKRSFGADTRVYAIAYNGERTEVTF